MIGGRSGLAAILALASAACGRGETPPPLAEPPKPEPPALSPREALAAEVRATLDPAIDPCVDFYRYACGGWLSTHPLPADRSRHGRGFGELADRNNAILQTILEEAAAEPADRELGTFYRACMDAATIDARGIEPLAPYLATIDAIADRRAFMATVGELHLGIFAGDGPLFGLRIEPDPRAPERYVLTLDQGGLGLPDRDYYLATSDDGKALLQRYEDHVATMLGFLGDPARAKDEAAAVVSLERAIAALGRPRSELRRPEAIYNKVGEAGLVALAPGLAWDAYFAALELGEIGPALNLTVPEHFAGLDRLIADAPIETLRAYLRWHLIHASAPHLAAPIVDADFELQRALTGLRELPPRAERCTLLANEGGLGEAIGPAFVRRIFPGESKALAATLIDAIEATFDAGLDELGWMDPATRARANAKIAALHNKVGHPERWRTFDAIGFAEGRHLENVAALQRFEGRWHAGQIGGLVDRQAWEMPPAVVNAYYSPPFNEMVFPAGILQPPYFSASWPMAMNFGGIGMVIGHELTHGFDDEGRKFDARGALREWWEPVAAERFGERAKCIEDAYSAIEILPGVRINGSLTLGENIADFGGIKVAAASYQRWVAEHGPEPRLLDELSNEQLLYVAFAQGWCSLSSPEITRLLAVVDPHAPPELRVNVPLAHHPGFAEAFACAPGTPMRAPAICEIW